MPTLRRLGTWLPALALAAGSLTCGGDIAEPPPPPKPATVESLAGNGQNGFVGQPLAESLVVRVKDADGRPFGGAVVAWGSIGGGQISQASVVSGTDGQAAVQWVLGDSVGRQATMAAVSGLPGVEFSATAEAVTRLPPRLILSIEPSGEAESSVQLRRQPVIRVESGEGSPLTGIEVTASTETGTLSGITTQQSDPSGLVRFADLALRGPAGSYHLVFSAPDISSVRSSAIALGPAPLGELTVLTQPSSSVLDHELFAPEQQPVVQLNDIEGSPVAGAAVTATILSTGAILEGNVSSITGADGRAQFVDLGIAGAGGQSIRFSSGAIETTSSPIEVAPLTQEATSGRWGPVIDWAANGADIVPVHLSLLPTGKLLAWGRMGQPWLWTAPPDGDPAAPGFFQEVPVDTMIFCAGHALLPDGRLLVSGGHLADDRGLNVTHTFDPFIERWSAQGELPNMAWGRWYPTVTVLSDGRALTVAGRDTAGAVVGVPELWDGTGWTPLSGAARQFPYYPKNFVAPDGRVFYAGERIQSWWLDVNARNAAGQGQWTAGPNHLWPYNRDYGSAVMYSPGKIIYVGGGGDPNSNRPRDATAAAPTNTAEVIDLNRPNPSWSSTGSMQFARRHLNATVLPDGQVLVTGGVSGAGFNNYASGVHQAELWNPDTGQWSTLSANVVNRAYHAVSLLLPSGAVLHGASGDATAPRETSHEIFLPPYLFKGRRPEITSAPSVVGYGQQFEVVTPYAGQVTRATLIRLGSVTHTLDANARFIPLPVVGGSSQVTVTAPQNPNLAPPGHYMLFLLNRNGVPSEGKILRLQ